MRLKFVWIGILIFMMTNLTGCTVTKLLSAKSHLDAGEYDKAATVCEEALISNQGSSPLRLKVDGTSVSADYFSYLCLGISYLMLDKYDKSTEYWLKSVEAFPDKAYFSYLGLAELNYHFGLTAKAYDYGLKAKETAGTKKYYEIMQRSALANDKEIWVNAADAAIDFYKLRLNYKELEEQIALNNKIKAIALAEQILQEI